MTHRTRSILALAILTFALVACGQTVAAPASETPKPAQPDVSSPTAEPTAEPTLKPAVEPTQAPAEPTEPAEPADEDRQVAGTITMAAAAFSGPGGTIQEAIDNPPTGEYPILLNGVIFRDTDGTVYLASSISDATAPTFDGPMLEVLEYPNDGPTWDMANADMVGLEEANGIVFKRNAQVLGYLEID
jgi:hypothetical protein